MPRFRRRSQCPECKLGRTINGFPCFCPPAYARAFKVVEKPTPLTAAHILRHIFVAEQIYAQPAPMIVQMTGQSYATSMAHGALTGLMSGIESQRFNATIIPHTGEIEVTPNLLLSTLAGAPPMPPEDAWNHFDEEYEHDSPELYS
jgi:hypothetical protein